MPIKVACSNCSKNYSIPEQHAGKQFKCKQCGKSVQVPSPGDEFDDDDFLDDLDGLSSYGAGSMALPPPGPPSSSPRSGKPKKKKAAKKSGGSGPPVGQIVGIIVGVFFGLGGIGFLIKAGLNATIPRDTSTWTTVNFGSPGISVKMPGTPKSQVVQSPDGPVPTKIYDRRTVGWLASSELIPDAGEGQEFDEFGAKAARSAVINLIRMRPGLKNIQSEGEVELHNGYWCFRTSASAEIKNKTAYMRGYYVLLPKEVVHLEYISQSPSTQEDADRFFATLVVPAGPNQPATPTQVASNSNSSAGSAPNAHAPDPGAHDAPAADGSESNESNMTGFSEFGSSGSNPPSSAEVTVVDSSSANMETEGFPPGFELSEGGPASMPPAGGGFNPLSFLPPAPPARPQGGPSYQEFRKSFQTQLIQRGPAPQQFEDTPLEEGVKKLSYDSDGQKLVGYEWRGDASSRNPKPAILFLHGGFACDPNEILAIKPFLDAGFVGYAPTYRGENGNEGEYSLFYNESTDAANAARWLANRRYVDKDHVYCIGHSAGGGVAALLSLIEDVPLRSTASVGGLYGETAFQPGIGLPTPFQPSPEEVRARTLFGNTQDMLREHYAYVGLLDLAMITAVGQINADIAVNGGRQPLFNAEYVGGDHFASFHPAMVKYFRLCMKDAGLDPSTVQIDPPPMATRPQPTPQSASPFKPSSSDGPMTEAPSKSPFKRSTSTSEDPAKDSSGTSPFRRSSSSSEESTSSGESPFKRSSSTTDDSKSMESSESPFKRSSSDSGNTSESPFKRSSSQSGESESTSESPFKRSSSESSESTSESSDENPFKRAKK